MTRQRVPFPTFKQLEEAVSLYTPSALLVWMALSQLSSNPGYTDLAPQQVYEKLRQIANEVYN